jgi:hypothetical protein
MPVSTWRYDVSGAWFKGNTHLHSTASDGGKAVTELTGMYASKGYDFLCLTDHWVASDGEAGGVGAPLLWLDGIELDGRDPQGAMYHVVCLGAFDGITRDMGFVTALEAARAQDGLTILAHPQWMGNSFDDALRWGFDGVEVYNHVCHWLNGKGSGRAYWNAMLMRSPSTLGFAVDDAHIRPEHPGWDGGWVVVNAKQRSREAIMGAIRAGNFYSSCGPEFHTIECDGQRVSLRSSPVQFARLVGPAHWGKRIGSFDGKWLDEATFDVPPEWSYAYLEIEDAQGRRAWTNSLFTA